MLVTQAAKNKLRLAIESSLKELIALQNNAMMKFVDKEIEKAIMVRISYSHISFSTDKYYLFSAVKSITEVVASGKKIAVLTLNIGSDSKAIKRAVEEFKKVAKDLSFLVVSAEESKLTVFAYVTEEAQKNMKLSANEWINNTLKAVGGKGGGKSGSAQGSCSDVSKLSIIVEESRDFLKKLGVDV